MNAESRPQSVVLVIEDDPMVCEWLSSLLKYYNPVEAASGEDALEWMSANPGVTVDLVVSDYRLSGINGAEAIQQIRTQAPAVKSVLISGVVNEELEEIARAHLCDAFLVKPFPIEAFQKIVAELLTPAPPPQEP